MLRYYCVYNCNIRVRRNSSYYSAHTDTTINTVTALHKRLTTTERRIWTVVRRKSYEKNLNTILHSYSGPKKQQNCSHGGRF